MSKSSEELVAEAKANVEQVLPDEAAAEIEAGAILLDVREPVEWEQHIEGAVQIPRGLIEFVADPVCGPRLPDSLKVGLDPGKRVIVYCNTGGRGALATYTLKTMGYERVANLDGGLAAWREAGLPVTEHHGLI